MIYNRPATKVIAYLKSGQKAEQCCGVSSDPIDKQKKKVLEDPCFRLTLLQAVIANEDTFTLFRFLSLGCHTLQKSTMNIAKQKMQISTLYRHIFQKFIVFSGAQVFFFFSEILVGASYPPYT